MQAALAACSAYGVFRALFHALHLNGVGVAGVAVDQSAGQHDIIPRLQGEDSLCVIHALVEQNLQRAVFFAPHRKDAPAQA